MGTFGIEYVGAFMRYLILNFYFREKITYTELWEKTKYGENIGYIKTSNHNIGVIFAFILFIPIIIIVKC
jgi:hypothetical protein